MNTPLRVLMPILLFLLLAAATIPLHAQTTDTLRYFDTSLQTPAAFSATSGVYIQRFRFDRPVRIRGFSIVVYAVAPSQLTTYIFRDAGGAGLPSWMDQQIRAGTAFKASATLDRPGEFSRVYFMLDSSQQLLLPEGGQIYVGATGTGDFLLPYDTTNNGAAMCSDSNPTIGSSVHELSSFVALGNSNARSFSVLSAPGPTGTRKVNGSFFITLFYEPTDAGNAPFFTDVTPSGPSGVLKGRALAWGDPDNDGDQDLLSEGVLWRNDGAGAFTRDPFFSAPEGPALFVDLDGDRWIDIATASKLYRNNGDGSWTERATTGLVALPQRATALVAADYDGDGLLDLFVAAGEKNLRAWSPVANDSVTVTGIGHRVHLYRNLGSFQFADVTATALIDYRDSARSYNPASDVYDIAGPPVVNSANWIDYDNDSRLDLFWGVGRLGGNYLWHNNGDGTFTNRASEVGLFGSRRVSVNDDGSVLGSDWEDIFNNSIPSLLLAQSAPPTSSPWSHRTAFYVGSASPREYVDMNNRDTLMGLAGIAYNAAHADAAFGDYDNDNLLDLYLTTSTRCYGASLYRQNDSYRFIPQTIESGTRTEAGRGAVWVDIDGDGDIDLNVGGEERGHLFRNDLTTGNNWVALGFRLKNSTNPNAIGATVRFHFDGVTSTRTVTAGFGSGTQKPSVVYCGLGRRSRLDSVEVLLPAGIDGPTARRRVLSADSVPINRYTMITGFETIPSTSVTIEEGDDAVWSVGPNPAREQVTVQRIRRSVMVGEPEGKILLLDLRGEVIRSQKLGGEGANLIVDLEGIASGYYQLRIESNGRVITRPVIVLK